MRYWDKPEGKTLQIFQINRYRGNGLGVGKMTAALIVPLVLFTACEGPAPAAAGADVENTTRAETTGANTSAAGTNEATCGQDGQLVVELYGSVRASIDWQADVLTCTGMPRPDGEGARVRMSGPLGTGDEVRTLAFILGLPGLEVGQTGTELPTNVTLIEEGTGRFFGTRDTSGCWTDVTSQQPVGDDSDRTYRIEGMLYCVSPLAELNGSTSVTFTELKFTGRINWEQPK